MESKHGVFNKPIVLIVFNRLDQARLIFACIRKLRPKKLFIISDGARDGIFGESTKVIQVRNIFNDIDWDCNVMKNYSTVNLGGKRRISSGLSWVFSMVDEAIILEDDCLPSHSFFQFCEEMLDRYKGDLRVGMVSGDNYWPDENISKYSYGFSKYMLTWGWATWKDRWSAYDNQIKDWPNAREENLLNTLFRSNNEIAYWKKIFNESYADTNDAYDYCWVFANWMHSRLCIFPRVNLISNIGFGDGATNTTNDSHYLANFPLGDLEFPLIHPKIIASTHRIEVEISKKLYSITTRKRMRAYIRSLPYVDYLVKKLKMLKNK